MKSSWLAFASGMTGGIFLMVALQNRNGDLSDWAGFALLGLAFLILGAKTASKRESS